VLNGKAKRPLQPRVHCEIINTTDWTEATWKNCRFYLSKGEVLMKVMDPEKDKRSTFSSCYLKDLSAACRTPKLEATASTSSAMGEAAKVVDDDVATSWSAAESGEAWLQLDFGKPVTINEFKLKEAPSSSVNRYVIQCWDEKDSRWVGCFNGRGIGAEFVAPIVSRTTPKARLLILATDNGKPSIAEFAAYHDTTGDALNVARGSATPDRVGK
jgi:hypothetical protein